MKKIIEHSGLFFILLATIILSIKQFNHIEGNFLLLISLILIFIGIVDYIVINKIIDK